MQRKQGLQRLIFSHSEQIYKSLGFFFFFKKSWNIALKLNLPVFYVEEIFSQKEMQVNLKGL